MSQSGESADSKPTPRLVRCPQCGGDSVWGPENKFRPFCSERCKMIDLGAWASESYRVPAEPGKGTPPSADDLD